MSKIISIGTALPPYRHDQSNVFDFATTVYASDEREKRVLRHLYRNSGIDSRYSVLPDFSLPASQWSFFPGTENLEPFPSVEKRLAAYQRHAPRLALAAIHDCLRNNSSQPITHLITVSCTGMSAPGLDLEILSLMKLPAHTWRTSVNFMGCYAAIHALKLADLICKAESSANVLIVSVELCTLHFQKDKNDSSLTSTLLFGDGAAAMLVSAGEDIDGLEIENFYSLVDEKGKDDMKWEISSHGFLMQLSPEIPDMINVEFADLVQQALSSAGLSKNDISNWCIHPGGKRILEAVQKSLALDNGALTDSFDVLREFGNMSSGTVVFVLDRMLKEYKNQRLKGHIFGAAFGPGLTMESFIMRA